METKTLNKFSAVIEQLLQLKQPKFEGTTPLLYFTALVDRFKDLSAGINLGGGQFHFSFPQVVVSLKYLSIEIYKERKSNTLKLILQNPDKLKLSCFELMEHDFRENTHSNIHQYIFDYHFLGKTAPELLGTFLGEECKIPEIKTKLLKQQYKLFRERSTGTGRIDLMIVDDLNKFLVIIENKVLAEVEVRDIETKWTQLNDYFDYANTYYSDYCKDFILLTFLNVTEDYEPYRSKNYHQLLSVIENSECKDDVLYQYKLLLRSLIHGVTNKPKRAREALNISNNEKFPVSLNDLELLNLIL